MFIHAFDGGWLTHPFWRARFVVRDAAQLARIRDSGVDGVVIDEVRGRALSIADPTPAPGIGSTASRPHPVPRAAADPGPGPTVPPLTEPARVERREMKQMLGRSERAMRIALNAIRAGQPMEAAALAGVVDGIMTALDRNPAMLLGLTRLKTKDNYTYVHSLSVAALMVNLAREAGLPLEQQRTLGLGGLLHDVGKMLVDPAVLNKQGPLDHRELAAMRLHPVQGHALLAAAGDVPADALEVCLHHHEKLDGTGYPHGLSGAAVTLPARIAAICDIYDAVTSERPYKGPWTPLEAVTAMDGWDGQLDRRLLFQFMKSLGVFPVGTLVRLRSNRLGIVHGTDGKGARSLIRAFYAVPDRRFIQPVEVTLGTSLGSDAVISRERPEAWGFSSWEAMQARLIAGQPIAAAA